MRCASPFPWQSSACTDVGRVRLRNEDACLDLPGRGLWAVADGMGGHALGDYASQAVVAALAALPAPATLQDALRDARAALQRVNQALLDEAARRRVPCIGSTVVVLLACGAPRACRCACLWAGDSRLYALRDGHLSRITHDHNRAEELRARRLITAGQARHHPAQNLVTRALGAAATLETEEREIEAEAGTVFLLCSDGLSNELCDEDIASILAACGDDCAQAARALVQAALERGGSDNVSAVVVRAGEAGLPAGPLPDSA
ncbi:serine/threonine protein phosphatase [Cupriavidus sp. USMAA2-4]|uniref:PP2C family protein-serine/threonine phosphatase n=1 Tax=Cupriavidus sp. USMAA2-4 TaxID=876364 RepID=UPI0008A6B48C|nr:protein phosphatase 2C domain-containing protein [Cupriavidus sp. USMAA2-4]AOY97347.1 serine/threonine protein phosphatase [Cupriavidus sp. USMAA2-4]